MQSKAVTVDQYLNEIPKERQAALTHLRKLCLEALVGYEENMEYGMPGYKVDGGKIEVAFASQKNYISFYVMKEDVMNIYRQDLSELNVGKGCIRYSKPEKIDFKMVEKLLIESRISDNPIC